MEEENEFLTLEEARPLFIGKPKVPRIRYWIRVGLFTGRVKLEARRSGKQLLTTKAWCEEFNRKMDEALTKEWGGNGKAPETTAQTKKRRAASDKRLAKLGVK